MSPQADISDEVSKISDRKAWYNFYYGAESSSYFADQSSADSSLDYSTDLPASPAVKNTNSAPTMQDFVDDMEEYGLDTEADEDQNEQDLRASRLMKPASLEKQLQYFF